MPRYTPDNTRGRMVEVHLNGVSDAERRDDRFLLD